MKKLFILMVMAVFAAGVGIGGLVSLQSDAMDLETYTISSRALSFNSVQADIKEVEVEPLKTIRQEPRANGPIERPSPGDWIQERQIEMRADGVFIHITNPQWAILADTNSMDPVFDEGSHLIQMFPTSPDQIIVGDIVSYASPMGFTIVHRVKEISFDEDGWYAILQGDNNPTPDPWKVRFDMVRRVTVMIVY